MGVVSTVSLLLFLSFWQYFINCSTAHTVKNTPAMSLYHLNEPVVGELYTIVAQNSKNMILDSVPLKNPN